MTHRSILFLSLFLLSACSGAGIRRPAWEGPRDFRQETPAGLFTSRVEWTVNPETKADVLHGELAFLPDPLSVACPKLGFVQVARVTTEAGEPLRWPMSEAPRNEMRTPGGFFVDHRAGACATGAACSAYFADHWPNEGGSSFGGTDGLSAPVRAATLEDYPFGWTEFRRIELEACAICDSSQEVFGCIRWGGEWPATGPKRTLKVKWRAQPGESFRRARQNFDRYYKPRSELLGR